MKIVDLINISKVFKPDMKFNNIQTGYKIMKFLKSLENDITFYNEKLTEIVKECAEKDGANFKTTQNGDIIINKDKIDLWQEKTLELSNIEVEVELPKFKLEEFDGCNFSIAELNMIELLITE